MAVDEKRMTDDFRMYYAKCMRYVLAQDVAFPSRYIKCSKHRFSLRFDCCFCSAHHLQHWNATALWVAVCMDNGVNKGEISLQCWHWTSWIPLWYVSNLWFQVVVDFFSFSFKKSSFRYECFCIYVLAQRCQLIELILPCGKPAGNCEIDRWNASTSTYIVVYIFRC